MRDVTWIGLLSLTALASAGACSSSASSGGTQAASDTGAGGLHETTTTSAGGKGGSTGTGGTGPALVDGCDPAVAEDHTADATVMITVGGGSNTFTPACVRVAKGTMVTFAGSFVTHPIAGGNSPPTVDATSPITETVTGTSATFTMANAGSFGFFCETHQSAGMMGAIFVE